VEPVQPIDPPVPTSQYTLTPADAGRFAGLIFRRGLRRGPAPVILVAASLVVAAVVLDSSGWFAALFAFVVTLALMLGVVRLGVGRSSAKVNKAGIVVQMSLLPDRLWVGRHDGGSDLPYGAITDAQVEAGCVVLRRRNRRGVVVLPRELCDDAMLAELRARVAAAPVVPQP
jgi:hypothetical protein